MTAQPCIDAAALAAAGRGILAAPAAHLSPWAAGLLVDLEAAANLAEERAAAGRPVTLLALAEQLTRWRSEPDAAPPGTSRGPR